MVEVGAVVLEPIIRSCAQGQWLKIFLTAIHCKYTDILMTQKCHKILTFTAVQCPLILSIKFYLVNVLVSIC